MKNSYKIYQRVFGLLAFSAIGLTTAQAQLSVSPVTGAPSTHAAQLAQALVGQGVTVTNATLTGGDSSSVGFFNGANSNIGIGNGIIITNGNINNAVGPNNTGGVSAPNGGPTIPVLNALLTNQTTQDGTMLEFDVEVDSAGLFFQYVFASDEYPEWACSGFNDVFGFFISGPGITGNMGTGFPGVRNIAQLAGTTTPVTINTINNQSCGAANVQFYVDNGTGTTPNVNTSVQYDGFTTVLVCEVYNLTPGEVYHLQIAIADVGDTSMDSGVFLEANSLRSCSTPDCAPLAVNANQFPAGIETRFFPNPATELATLKIAGLPENVAGVEVQVTDLMGREVARTSQGINNAIYAEVDLSVSALPTGLYQYFVRSLAGQPLAAGRFAVSR